MNADALLQLVKDRAGLPVGIVALTDAKVIGCATEEMLALVAPLLVAFGEDYFTDYDDVPIVSGVSIYPIPTRAIASMLRKVAYLNSSGTENWQPLPRVELRDTGLFSPSTVAASPFGFYPTATDIVLVEPPTTGTIRIWYSRRPGALVLDTVTASQHTQVGTITSVVFGSPNTTITLNANHNGWPASTSIDIQGARSPFKLKARDITTSTAVAGTATILIPNLDLTSASTYGIQANDYVTLANSAYIPAIPQEWHSVLELRACARVAGTLGKTKLQMECNAAAGELATSLKKISAPRTQLNPRKVSAWRP